MGLLKRLFGTEDAMAEARAGELAAERAEIHGATTTSSTTTQGTRPAGWGEVETSQEGENLVIALPAPRLDESSVRLEPDEGSDASQAQALYTDRRLVVRIPKSALKTTRAG